MATTSGRFTYAVTAEALGRYREAVGGWVHRGVPSSFASVYCHGAVAAMRVRDGVVLTGQEFDFHAPVVEGDVLTTEFNVVDEFEKRGRRYMVIATRTVNQSGQLVSTGRITRMLPEKDAR